MGTLHEDQYTFVIISCSVLIRMRNVSDKSCRENQNTHFMFSVFFFFFNHAIYVIMWKNVVEAGGLQMIIQCIRIACKISKAANTQSEYVILIAFPRQR